MRTLLLAFIARLLFLPMLIFAFALLVKGYSSAGGGFAAGAIAGMAILLQRIVLGNDAARDILSLRQGRTALALGLALPLGLAVAPALAGGGFLVHFPAPGEHVIHLGRLELHTSLIFDTGVALLVLAFALEAVRLVAPSRSEEP